MGAGGGEFRWVVRGNKWREEEKGGGYEEREEEEVLVQGEIEKRGEREKEEEGVNRALGIPPIASGIR